MSNVTGQNWLRIDIPCPEAMIDPVTDLLGVISGSGVEEKPVKAGESLLSGFFQLTNDNNEQSITSRVTQELGELFAIYEQKLPVITSSLMADQDWATCWQKFFKPFAIIPGLVIKPAWENYQPAPGEQIIEMEPGMAFGTGKHASTRLALALIHSCCKQQPVARVLDVGTGTGILAMAASLFGAEKVVAVDNDPDAVHICRDNCRKNNLEHIDCSETDISDINDNFSLICANIIYNVLMTMLPDFSRLLPTGGKLVLAGILMKEQEKGIAHQASQYGFKVSKILHEDEWSGILLIKK